MLSSDGLRLVLGGASYALAFLLLFSAPINAGERVFVSVGTGGPTGVYFVVGNAICRMVHKEAAEGRKLGRKHGIRCAAPSTSGSTYNIGNIKEGELDFGVVQSDSQYHAYHGSGQFEGRGFQGLRALFSVHAEPFHLIVRHGAEIDAFSDLSGKRVNMGNPGSGQRVTMEVLMKAYGMTRDDFGTATELTSTKQTKALCAGEIDAFGYTVGVPNAGVALATDGCDARIVSLDGEVERGLVETHPFYARVTIPKGTYKTTRSEITSFGVMATFVTGAEQPEAVVYEVVRAVFENFEDFKSLHPAFTDLDPSNMVNQGLTAPIHPGAIRYYEEKGWM